MSQCSLTWWHAMGVAALWVGTAAVFAVPLGWLIIFAATQLAYRGLAGGAGAHGASRFVTCGESALLAGVLAIVPAASGLAHRSWKVAGLAALLTAGVSLSMSVVLQSFYWHYAMPVIMHAERGSAGVTAASAAESDLNSDEIVVFFPTWAYLDEHRRTWTVPIHGVVYEPEEGSLTRDGMAAAIGRMVGVKAGTPEAQTFERRIRLFLVDNERGKDIFARIGAKVYKVGTSGPNGHFQGELRLSAAEIEQSRDTPRTAAGFLSFEAVTRTSDRRHFAGRAQLVGPTGLSIISDIDDTIKHSQVRDHKAMLANTFLHKFKPAPGMPELYAQCAKKGAVFHYVSGSPWQLYLPLSEFLVAERLPPGSFDLKDFRLKDPSALGLLQSQEATKLSAIDRIMTAFPKRRFILIGDSGEQDPEIYARVARDRGDQVAAIFIRNVTGEKLESPRFQAVCKGLAAQRLRLFDQPAEIQAVIEEIRQRPLGEREGKSE